MADNAELAFLDAQKEYDPSTSYEAVGEEEYDPATAYSPHAPSDVSASMPESAGNSPRRDGDGEGENGLKPAPAPVSAEVSATPTLLKQPRTRGGFVDESEDEEEEPAAQPTTAASALQSASGAAESPQRSFTNTPSNTLPNPDVQLHSAQDQGALPLLSASVAVNESAPFVASTLPNGSAPAPDVAMTGAPAHLNAQQSASAVPVTRVPASNALPKARLPQDRIGILEDRIAEDPRGDIEAWLSLIEEHRRRHKNDDARAVFDRFLKVFPTAVSRIVHFPHDFANTSRASNGSNSLPLKPSATSCLGWKSYSASLSRWRPMCLCTRRTLTSSAVATT
jgi:cleavage stimulation factor subunit 3